MKSTRLLSVICVVIGGALLVGACDSRGQSRPLNYQKGTYLGKPHASLSEPTLEKLRARALYQAGLSTVSGGGELVGARTEPGDVRPPAVAGTVDMDALRQRAGRQSR